MNRLHRGLAESNTRLRALDGLRGVAILLVIGFHYFHALAAPNNQTTFYPYGDIFADIVVFKYGYLGVELFFIISGFVIAMTLEKCDSPIDFLVRRVSRIWPPLVAISVVTFLFIKFIPTPFAETANQHWENFLPSLTLTPPGLWAWTRPDVRFVDFVYWSLVVEVRFYFFAALLYWGIGSSDFARNFVVLTCVIVAIKTVLKFASPTTNDIFFQLFIPSFLPWFAAGIIFHDLYRKRISARAAFLLLLPMLAIILRYSFLDEHTGKSPYIVAGAGILFFGIFWFVATRPAFGAVIGLGPLVTVGACSYSIYLMHFEIGASVISTIPKTYPVTIQVLMVSGLTLSIVLLSWISLHTLERGGQSLLRRQKTQ